MVIDEIATLLSVARNDKRGLRYSLDSSAKGGLNKLSPYKQAKAKLALCHSKIKGTAIKIFDGGWV